MMEATTLAITSRSMIPRQLEGLLGSPFLGSSLRRPTHHSWKQHWSLSLAPAPSSQVPQKSNNTATECTRPRPSGVSARAWRSSAGMPLSPCALPLLARCRWKETLLFVLGGLVRQIWHHIPLPHELQHAVISVCPPVVDPVKVLLQVLLFKYSHGMALRLI